VALVGLVRVSTSKQETARQHDALDGLCVKVFEEKISGRLAVDARPTLAVAIDYLCAGDMLDRSVAVVLAGSCWCRSRQFVVR
jgi:DNA invertase Pin-like site-specific DNA recombinase